MLDYIHCVMSLKDDKLIIILSLLVGIDFLSGYTKAFTTKQPSSKVGTIGLIKHMSVYFLIIMFDSLFKFMNFTQMGDLFVMGGIATNGLSIIENYRAMGWTGSKWLDKFFANLSDQSEAQGEKLITKITKGDDKNA